MPYTMIDLFLILQLLAGSGCGIRRVFDLIRKEEHDVPETCTVLFKDAFPLEYGNIISIAMLCYIN